MQEIAEAAWVFEQYARRIFRAFEFGANSNRGWMAGERIL